MFIKHLLTVLTVVGSANAACFDNGDKEIGGSCYKLVPQKLTFADAQNWCHYQNPVTSSYLAFVPNQFTANFLASYARSAFGTDDGNFWIGLSRKTSNSQWMWDDGQSLGFSNFGGQLGQNYVAESIVNAKWNTYGSADTNFFVCSYNPQAPPTFAPQTTNVPVSTIPVWTSESPTTTGNCTPTSPRSLFYAYSTDLDPSFFKDILFDLQFYEGTFIFKLYANARLDLKHPESIEYHSDRSSWNTSLYSHYPNSSLGYSDTTSGSDVLNIIEQFLDNTQVPVCGSIIHIVLKRYPNERGIERLVAKIRQNHSFVIVTIPTNPSGGLYYQTMYELATKTNGFGFYAGTDQGYNEAESDINWWESFPFSTYSVNVNVSRSGSMNLSDMSLPRGSALVFITVQDSGTISTFQNMNLTFNGPTDSFSLLSTRTTLEKDRNFMVDQYYFYDDSYKVTLHYNYSDARQQTLQIRVASNIPIDYWIPYAN